MLSYWMGATYGLDSIVPMSAPANVFRHTKVNKGKTSNSGIYAIAYSHDRPDLGVKTLAKSRRIGEIETITMLRDVHGHRESMVNRYVRIPLNKACNGGKFLPDTGKFKNYRVKEFNKPLRNATYANWVRLDDPKKPWQGQTYSQPQLGAQPIGFSTVRLDGARSYQLKWVARARDPEQAKNDDECGGSSQADTEPCPDKKLLTQGKRALADMPYFGLIHKFKRSVCLLHYMIRQPWPKEDSAYCGEKSDEIREHRNCVSVTSCIMPAVCPAGEVDAEVHSYGGAEWQSVEDLINEVEAPEVAFLEYAEDLFDERYAAAKADVKCMLNSGKLKGSEAWLGPSPTGFFASDDRSAFCWG